MHLEVRGYHFPGRSWPVDGEERRNVHLGIQVGRDPCDLVPGDAEEATWHLDVEVAERDGAVDFRGPAVQGKRGDRFVYLTWGDVGGDGTFTLFRRAKLMLDDVVAVSAHDPGGRVIASVDLTDECGGPRCARLRPPALTVTPG